MGVENYELPVFEMPGNIFSLLFHSPLHNHSIFQASRTVLSESILSQDNFNYFTHTHTHRESEKMQWENYLNLAKLQLSWQEVVEKERKGAETGNNLTAINANKL